MLLILYGPIAHGVEEPQLLPDDSENTPSTTEDTIPPNISTNLVDGQALSGTAPLTMTVDEANPLEYSISLRQPDGTNIMVDGQLIGTTERPPADAEMTLEWDTLTVANGEYEVVFSARDQVDLAQTVIVSILVANESGKPMFLPITPILAPIPITASLATPPPRTPEEQSVSHNDNTSSPAVINKMDILAERIQDAAIAAHEAKTSNGRDCVLFFGVCWYWSVPTLVVGGASYAIYRIRQREP